jgi:hypothetical protein
LLVGSNGHRPLAWWRYEAPFPYPGYDSEQSTLYEADLLAETERAELVAFWREQFDRASDPNFFFTGRGEILRGEAAHRAHCRWADIPPSLIEAWSAERERSAEAPTLPGRSQ